MKLGQLIDYITEIFFFKIYAENEASRPVFIFKYAFYEVTTSGL